MKAVYKYELVPEYLTIELPVGYQFISAAEQNGSNYVWAIVDIDEEMITNATIHIFGTGHDIDPRLNLLFIDTIQMKNGLVFHVFEELGG